MNARRLTLLMMLIAGGLGGCCGRHAPRAASPPSKKSGAASLAPATPLVIQLTGFLMPLPLPLAPDNTVLIEFPPVDYLPGVPLIANHFTRMHIAASTPARDFQLLFGPVPGADPYGQGFVDGEASAPSFMLLNGFVIFAGAHPLGRSNWVRATGLGTTMAIRVSRNNAGEETEHIVYNLSQGATDVQVQREGGGPIVTVPPGHELHATSGGPLGDPRPIVTDPLLQKIRNLAAAANLPVD